MTITHDSASEAVGALDQPLRTLIDGPVPAGLDDVGPLSGFSGLHGGVSAMLVARHMLAAEPRMQLRALHARFLRRAITPVEFRAHSLRRGRTVTWSRAAVFDAAGALLLADGVLTADAEASAGRHGRPMPRVRTPEQSPVARFPEVGAPILDHVEFRNAGPAAPFAGGRDPELLMWVRPAGDPAPVDTFRVMFLLDSLVPSRTATMRGPLVAPSLELSIHLNDVPAGSPSPWLLLRARTIASGGVGWITEDVDAWSRSGVHVATSRQLRLALGPT